MFQFGTYRKRKYIYIYSLVFFIKFLLIITRSVSVLSCPDVCVEDHNINKSWTLLCFYPQLYLIYFQACKAKSNCLLKKL